MSVTTVGTQVISQPNTIEQQKAVQPQKKDEKDIHVTISKDKLVKTIAGAATGGAAAVALRFAGNALIKAETIGIADGGVKGLFGLFIKTPGSIGALAGGVTAALVAPGRPLLGAAIGAGAGAVAGLATSLVAPAFIPGAVVFGAISGAVSGAAGSFVAGKVAK